MAHVCVRPVRTRRDLGAFLRLPWHVYRPSSPWIPPLRRAVRDLLDPRHPFWSHGERELFLAESRGTPVGRIAAIVNHRHNAFHGERTGFFGFFEALPREDAPPALLEAVAEWLRRRGQKRLRGPVNPSTNYECGLLVEGFDTPPRVMMPYNPPWYARVLENWGLRKAKDLVAYRFRVPETVPDRLARAARAARRRLPGLVVRSVRLKAFREELARIREIYNTAWEKNWGFVPMSEAEMERMARDLKPFLVPELVQIAEVDGEPAGFLMALPDIHAALKPLNGRLGPLGLLRFFWRLRRIREARLLTLGIKPAYRRRGVDAALMEAALKAAQARGYREAELSWILEDNWLTRRAAEAWGGRVSKIYRIYEAPL